MNRFSNRYLWPIVIIFSALLSALLAFGKIGGALRPVFLFWFILICPGMAIIRLIRIGDPVFELVLSIALSFALGTLFAELLVFTKHWSPPAVLGGLIIISLAGAILQLRNPPEQEIRKDIARG